MAGDIEETRSDDNSVVLKDPPVIRKGSAKILHPVTKVLNPELNNVNIWVNDDGSVSKPVEQSSSKKKNAKKRKPQSDPVNVVAESSMKDPPVCNSISVVKGNRMKPQSEKNSRKKKKT
jgi:hypothetical protein